MACLTASNCLFLPCISISDNLSRCFTFTTRNWSVPKPILKSLLLLRAGISKAKSTLAGETKRLSLVASWEKQDKSRCYAAFPYDAFPLPRSVCEDTLTLRQCKEGCCQMWAVLRVMAEIELVFSKVNSLGMFLMSHLLKLICRVRLTVFSVSNVSLSVFWLLARPCLIRCILWALWDCCTAFPEILLAFQAQGCGSCVWKCLCIAKHRWTGLHWGAVLASIKLVEFHRWVRYTNAAAWWHLRATPRCIFRDILSRSCSFSSSFCSYSFSLLIGMLFCYPVVNSESWQWLGQL